jgi:uncharacterized membrane protein
VEGEILRLRPQNDNKRPARTGWELVAARLRSANFLQVLFFAYIAIALLILTFFVPPFQKADEAGHYWRSVALTNLDLACKKDVDGNYFYAMKRKYADFPYVMHTWDVAYQQKVRFNTDWLRASFDAPLYKETGRVYEYCGFAPTGFLPSALGVLVGKPFINPLISLYLGRVAGAFFFIGCFLLALKVTPPRYRLLVYFYAALPTVLHQVSAVSYDVVQLSLSPVIFGYLTKFLTEDRLIKPVELFTFMVLVFWAINVRLVPFSPLVLLFFALKPANVAASRSQYLRTAAVFAGVTAAVTLIGAAIYFPEGHYASLIPGEINSHRQLQFVVSHPDKFVAAAYRTFKFDGEWLFKQTLGVFGWTDTAYDYFPYYAGAFAAAIVFYFVAERDVAVVNLRQAAIILGAVLASVAALFISLYSVWSPVGYGIVEGLQGRYLVGLLPFGVFGLSQVAAVVGKRRFVNALAAVFVLVLLRDTFRAIDLRFYG